MSEQQEVPQDGTNTSARKNPRSCLGLLLDAIKELSVVRVRRDKTDSEMAILMGIAPSVYARIRRVSSRQEVGPTTLLKLMDWLQIEGFQFSSSELRSYSRLPWTEIGGALSSEKLERVLADIESQTKARVAELRALAADSKTTTPTTTNK